MTVNQKLRVFSRLDASEKQVLGYEAGAYLIGTTLTIQSALDDGFLLNRFIRADDDPTLDAAFCKGVDSAMKTCAACGWNVESDEVDDAGKCYDCQAGTSEDEHGVSD